MPKYFQLSVMAPMKNFSFVKGTSFSTTFASEVTTTDATTGVSNIDVKSIVPTLLCSLGAGDKVKLGPSTNTLNPGATEEKTVLTGCVFDNGTSSNIDFTTNLIFGYEEGDPISGVGNYFPDGWVAPTYTSLNNITGHYYNHPKLNGINLPVSSRDTSALTTFTSYGVDNYFCLKSYIDLDTNISSQNLDFLRYNFTNGDLLESTYYRFGFFYKYKLSDIGDFGINSSVILHDGVSEIDSDIYLNLNEDKESTYWKQYIGSPVITASSLSGSPYLLFRFRLLSATAYTFYHNIDSVYLEHAKGTDDASKAVYTFTEMPALGTQSWKTETFEYSNQLASGVLKYNQYDDRKNIRYNFSCNFENVSNDFLKNLMVLKHWQSLGYDLVFHTGEYFGSSPSRIPPVLVGKMKLSNIRKSSWDASKFSVVFNFYEVY